MKLRHVRSLVAAFFLLFVAAVTWPGFVPFNRIEPRPLGLPFSMAWPALWIVVGGAALWLLDRAETRQEDPGGPEGREERR